ncbi:hypothetical protein Mbo2_032 [Rhodococcus phage Mbo2]|uniref:Uncharacterized protein n=1 Tax=Rhodococcus phage Mbo2 TaxID=2936911 RepID=A0A9E7ILN0_9CAUD|nr:hypothetical protein Mbo2_032 [Rhodococcus phage Mbo2]
MAGLSERSENDPSPVFESAVIETGRDLEHAELVAGTVDADELPLVTELEEVTEEPS